MTLPLAMHPFEFEHCLGQISGRIPLLRSAIDRRDDHALRGLVRELHPTLGMLNMPKLFQLGQEIEYRQAAFDPEAWQKECVRFCEQLERVHFSLREKLGRN